MRVEDDPPAAASWRLPLLLLVATLATTGWAGWLQASAFYGVGEEGSAVRDPRVPLGALSYVLGLIGILAAHEAGHWLAGRRLGLAMSPPFFLPGVPPIGTFGAVIRLDLQRMAAQKLLSVAAWGPVAGFVALLPVLWFGVGLSEVRALAESEGEWMQLGEPLLMQLVIGLQHGAIGAGEDLYLHPLAFAGWTGLLVTALNLIPLGQLDGGHVARAALGPVHGRLAPYLFVGLLAAGAFLYLGWLVIAVLLAVLVGVRNPHAISEEGLAPRGRVLAGVTLVIFVLSVTPTPVY